MIHEILPSGKSNAVPGHVLIAALHLRELRELTQIIERERKDGFPICASTGDIKGYYLAATPGELEDYIKSLGRRILNMGRTMTHLEDTLLRMTGQEKLKEW